MLQSLTLALSLAFLLLAPSSASADHTAFHYFEQWYRAVQSPAPLGHPEESQPAQAGRADDYGTPGDVGTDDSSYCPRLSTTTKRGARDATTGGQVSELQKFLSDYYDLDTEEIVSGFFGRITQGYVIRFQKEQSLPAFGIVGSLTRAAIAKVCGDDTMTGTPSMQVNVVRDFRYNVTYQNLPNSSIVLVNLSNNEEPALVGIVGVVVNNAQGNGVAELEETNYRIAGYYYLQAVTYGPSSREIARSNTFYLGRGGTTPPPPTPPGATGRYEIFIDGSSVFVKDGVTKEKAISHCQETVRANPSATSLRCTWNGLEIFNSSAPTPPTTPPATPPPTLPIQIPQNIGTALGNDVNNCGQPQPHDGQALAFDDNILQDHDHGFCKKNATPDAPATIGKDWGRGQKKIITTYKIYSSNDLGFTHDQGENPPIMAALQGSNDNNEWVTLNKIAIAITDNTGTVTIKPTGSLDASLAYRYHRLAIWSPVGPANIFISEVRFFETPSATPPPATPGITVTSPNGGERWEIGTMNTITWTPYNPNAGINPASEVKAYLTKKVLYKTGAQYDNVGEIIPSGKASIHWTGQIQPPGAINYKFPEPGEYYINVINAKTDYSDLSDAPFTLLPRSVDLKLNGSDGPIIVDTNRLVQASWTATNVARCELHNAYPDLSRQTQIGSVPLSGTRDIYLHPNTGPTLYCYRSDGTVRYDSVEVNVQPSSANLQITSPNGGEKLAWDKDLTIQWKQKGLSPTVSIALYKNDTFYYWIQKSAGVEPTTGIGAYSWNPRVADVEVGISAYKIYITGQKADGTGYIEDKSDAPFGFASLTTPPTTPTMTIIAPEANEPFILGTVGGPLGVVLSVPNKTAGTIKVSLITQDGRITRPLGEARFLRVEPDGGASRFHLSATIPDVPAGSNYLLSTDYTYDDNGRIILADMSNVPFSITAERPQSPFVLYGPDPNAWPVSVQRPDEWRQQHDPLFWDYRGTTQSPTRPKSPFVLYGPDPNAWPVSIQRPDTWRQEHDPLFWDYQQPSITVTSPNGGDQWNHGTPQTVRWTSNSNKNVRVELRKNDEFVIFLAKAVPAQTGTLSFTPHFSLMADSGYKVRMSLVDADEASSPTAPIIATDDSDRSFNVAFENGNLVCKFSAAPGGAALGATFSLEGGARSPTLCARHCNDTRERFENQTGVCKLGSDELSTAPQLTMKGELARYSAGIRIVAGQPVDITWTTNLTHRKPVRIELRNRSDGAFVGFLATDHAADTERLTWIPPLALIGGEYFIRVTATNETGQAALTAPAIATADTFPIQVVSTLSSGFWDRLLSAIASIF